MTDYYEMRRLYDQYRWELVTKEALKERRREQRRTILQHFAAWSLVAVSIYVFGPAIARTAEAIWRAM